MILFVSAVCSRPKQSRNLISSSFGEFLHSTIANIAVLVLHVVQCNNSPQVSKQALGTVDDGFISHTTAGESGRGGGGEGGGGTFVAPLSLSNWVKVDVPLSETHTNCSGHKNKLFSIWFERASL